VRPKTGRGECKNKSRLQQWEKILIAASIGNTSKIDFGLEGSSDKTRGTLGMGLVGEETYEIMNSINFSHLLFIIM
jgi:hypothetical protein